MSAARDPDELTRAEAVALYHSLEERAAALGARRAPRSLPRRRWVVLAPVFAGLAIAAAVATNSLTGTPGAAPASNAGPANAPLVTTGALPLVPGEHVRSISHRGTTTTIRYRSGLIEVISPPGGPAPVGPRSMGLTLGGTRIVLSGVDPARLRRAAGALEGPQP
jgi:hypothetical protein